MLVWFVQSTSLIICSFCQTNLCVFKHPDLLFLYMYLLLRSVLFSNVQAELWDIRLTSEWKRLWEMQLFFFIFSSFDFLSFLQVFESSIYSELNIDLGKHRMVNIPSAFCKSSGFCSYNVFNIMSSSYDVVK